MTGLVLARPLGNAPMNGIIGHLRIGLRRLARNPGSTVLAVAILALGIGTNTAIFSVVDAVLLRPLPFPESERLVALCERHPSVEGFCVASPPNVGDWQRASEQITTFGIARGWAFTLQGDEGAEGVRGAIATPGWFRTLGLQAAHGRLPSEREQRDGARTAVVSDRFWRQRLGGDASWVGRALPLDGKPWTVIGILPPGVAVPGLEDVEVWRPLHLDPDDDANRDWRGFRAIGRLAPGADVASAGNELGVLHSALAERYPASNRDWGVEVRSLHALHVEAVRPTLLAFQGAVICVLLIVCVHLAGLLLANAADRRGEWTIRRALGASRGRLVRAQLTESGLVAVAGGALGIALAHHLLRLFLRLAPGGMPRLDSVGIDRTALVFALALTAISPLLFALLPAWRASRSALQSRHLASTRSGLDRRQAAGRDVLVIAEIAIATTLLMAAGLLVRHVHATLGWHPGFAPDRVLVTWLLSSESAHPQGDQVAALHRRAVEAIAALPGIEQVGTASAGPLFGGDEPESFTVAGRPSEAESVAMTYDVDPGFLPTLQVSVVRGRHLGSGDTADAPHVAVVNQTFARRFLDDRPLGTRLEIRDRSVEVVGVVSDLLPAEPGVPVEPAIYWPHAQTPRWATHLVARTAVPAATLATTVRQRLRAVDPAMRVSPVTTLAARLDRRLASPRFTLALIGLLAALAATLAALGVYGVVRQDVSRRRRELGVRMALGATPSTLIGGQVGAVLTRAGIGIGLGIGAGLALRRVLVGLAPGVAPHDPWVLTATAVLFLVTTAFAGFLPALRAVRHDPLAALRADR